MPVVTVSVIVAEYTAIIAGIYQVVDIGQIIASYDAIVLPHFISDGPVAALA